MTIEAMKQALEALEKAHPKPYNESVISHVEAITALRTAIEQAEKQEPVAWEDVLGAIARGWAYPENARKPMDVQLAVAIAKEIQDMYTTPPSAQRQPLTDEQRRNIVRANKMRHDSDEIDPYGVIDDVEAAHGITGEKT